MATTNHTALLVGAAVVDLAVKIFVASSPPGTLLDFNSPAWAAALKSAYTFTANMGQWDINEEGVLVPLAPAPVPVPTPTPTPIPPVPGTVATGS